MRHPIPGPVRAAALVLGLAVAATPSAAPAAPGAVAPALAAEPACTLHYEVTPRHDRVPRVLEVSVSFPAAGRGETWLRTTGTWAGIADFADAMQGWRAAQADTRIEPDPDRPGRWRVTHPGSGRVRLGYEVRAALSEPDDGLPQARHQLFRPQIGADWFQFIGHGVLPAVEPWGDEQEVDHCVSVHQPGAADAPAFGSHGWGRGALVRMAWRGSPWLLRHGFYAGGTGWRLSQRPVAGGVLHAAVRGRFPVDDAEFADRSAALIGTHRAYWGATDTAPQWIVLTPNFMQEPVGGTLVHRTVLLHADRGFRAAGPTFEFLVGHEHLHQWFPARFGAMPQGPDEAQVPHRWFSEGFTDYYTHRLLLASGLWTLPQYAAELSRVAQRYWTSPLRQAPLADLAPVFFSTPGAATQLHARGEWLALQWDHALRARGHAGLDALLRGLLLPADAAVAGDAPATERVLAALTAELGEAPREAVRRHVTQSQALGFHPPDLAGPCFTVGWADEPRWDPGFDAAASFGARQASGVAADGPAHAAGLREGMALLNWSFAFGDATREVELTVAPQPDAAPRTLRYLPAKGSHRLPGVRVRDGAAQDPACRAWVRAVGKRPG